MVSYVILYGNALEGVTDAIGDFDSETDCDSYLKEFPAEEHLVTKIINLEQPEDGDWKNEW